MSIGKFNSRVEEYSSLLLGIVALVGAVLFSWIMWLKPENVSPKMLGFVVFMTMVSCIAFIAWYRIFRKRLDRNDRRKNFRHPGYMDVPAAKIKPPTHRVRRQSAKLL